jgi:hypothetical protein
MDTDKKTRVANAVGFVSGVIASMDAIRDQRTLWPPAALWDALRHGQRLELAAGVALIVVTLVLAIARKRSA